MATMVAEVYRALREAGASDASAEAAASSVAVGTELATKADIVGQRSEMLDRIAENKSAIEHLRSEMLDRIAENKSAIESLRSEMLDRIAENKSAIESFRSEMLDRLAKVERQQALLLYGYGPVTIGLLVKLAFFPS